jgi:hypothetical protein
MSRLISSQLTEPGQTFKSGSARVPSRSEEPALLQRRRRRYLSSSSPYPLTTSKARRDNNEDQVLEKKILWGKGRNAPAGAGAITGNTFAGGA